MDSTQDCAQDENRLLSVEELARMLALSPKTVRVDSSRRPHTLPPRFVIPDARRLAWRYKDVVAWMDAMSKAQEARRRAHEEYARTRWKSKR